MKIAIATRRNLVEQHFGQCITFTLVEIDENMVPQSSEEFHWDEGCGCKSNLIETFSDKGVTCLLTGNIGAGAYNALRAHGIDVVRGCTGPVDSVLEKYLKKEISDQEILCRSSHHH